MARGSQSWQGGEQARRQAGRKASKKAIGHRVYGIHRVLWSEPLNRDCTRRWLIWRRRHSSGPGLVAKSGAGVPDRGGDADPGHGCVPISQARRAKGRPVPWSFGPEPTSSPASSTPRCVASGLDLGPEPKVWLCCRRRFAVSFAREGHLPGCVEGPHSPLAVTAVAEAKSRCVQFPCLRGGVHFTCFPCSSSHFGATTLPHRHGRA